MRRFNLLSAALSLLLALAPVMPASLGAQEVAREGIAVHGDWVIEVYQPDGTLAERRAFSNAMTLEAQRVLAWSATEGGSYSFQAILLTGCRDAPGGGPTAAACNLPVTTNQDGITALDAVTDAPTDLVLSGSIVADLATLGTSEIDEVETWVALCPSGVDPCELGVSVDNFTVPPGHRAIRFTETTLGTPVQVADGQLIEVTVTISFTN